ncbi:hypothetical protein VO57_015600 [Citromicrobium bathyomarinum]|nr:hypothetical protein [Citromicrobium sp. JL2201]KPM23974.1 hypothetical protein VO57_10710 [Citromicrobium sp. JL2201]
MNAPAPKSVLESAKAVVLDPNTIDVFDRIGFYFPDKAAAFGRLMAIDGQRDPIKVSAQPEGSEFPWRLHVGLHRTMGARIEGIGIHALVVDGTPAELEQLEASENLHRRTPPPIERAKFTAALVRAAQERIAREHGDLSQQELAIKARWARVKHGEEDLEKALNAEVDDTADKMSAVYGWQDAVADALGFDKRTIRRDLALYRLVVEPFPRLAEPLSQHPVVGENASQLKKIAEVKDEAARRRVIEALLENPESKVEDALVAAEVAQRGPDATPAPQQKFVNQILGGWSRLSIGQKRRFLPSFVEQLTPDMKAQLRELLDEEQG